MKIIIIINYLIILKKIYFILELFIYNNIINTLLLMYFKANTKFKLHYLKEINT